MPFRLLYSFPSFGSWTTKTPANMYIYIRKKQKNAKILSYLIHKGKALRSSFFLTHSLSELHYITLYIISWLSLLFSAPSGFFSSLFSCVYFSCTIFNYRILTSKFVLKLNLHYSFSSNFNKIHFAAAARAKTGGAAYDVPGLGFLSVFRFSPVSSHSSLLFVFSGM